MLSTEKETIEKERIDILLPYSAAIFRIDRIQATGKLSNSTYSTYFGLEFQVHARSNLLFWREFNSTLTHSLIWNSSMKLE